MMTDNIVGGRQVCDQCHAGRPGPDPSLPYGKARCDNCGDVMVVDR